LTQKIQYAKVKASKEQGNEELHKEASSEGISGILPDSKE
jgi:hypothetical protein